MKEKIRETIEWICGDELSQYNKDLLFEKIMDILEGRTFIGIRDLENYKWDYCPKCHSDKIVGVGERDCWSEKPFDSMSYICEKCGHLFGYDTRKDPKNFGLVEVKGSDN